MASSFQFRNITTYVVEPEGEPVQSLPSKSSLDFSPQSSCIEEAPDDGNQYARQSKSWQEIAIPTNTSDLNNDSDFITSSVLTKENIVGLELDSTPEFADTLITGLKSDAGSGGEVPATLYNWFKSVYSSLVDSSVKSWIVGIVTILKDLADRVVVIEDNSYFDFFKIPTKHLRQYDYFNAAKTSATSGTTGAPLQDAIMLIPICISDDTTVDLARMRVNTLYSGGKMRIGIYEGNQFYPYTRIWQSSELTQDAAGVKDAVANFNLIKGKMYWFAFITNNVNVRMFSYQIYQLSPIKGNDGISSNVHSILFANYTYGELPSTLDGLSLNESFTFFPVISLRKA